MAGVIAACAIGARAVSAQLGPIPGQSVNMVSGTEWPDGDPFLQRQNEGSLAVSTRNPQHILGGGNDYRTVDIPGLPGQDVIADAWLGVFWSRDGGHRWKSTLLPGYPQDASVAGQNSPIRGLQAGADPVVRAGANGMMFFAGIAFNRESPSNGQTIGKKGALFLARFIDDNAKETGNPFRYLSTVVADTGSAGRFLDKPWLAVDIPRAGAGSCSVPGTPTIPPQTFPAGNIYLTYTTFVGGTNNIRSTVWFKRSTDCGRTWGPPSKLSEGYPVNQGSVIAIDPATGAVSVAWRRFKANNESDGILFARSTDGGQSFTKPIQVASFAPHVLSDGSEVSRLFEQGTTIGSFRTTSFPALTVDQDGVAYVAWAQRAMGPNGIDARIMISRSSDGTTWSAPAQIDPTPEPGHQFMPSLAFHAGRVVALYHTQREDHTIGRLAKEEPDDIFLTEQRDLAGNLLLGQAKSVFWEFLADFAPTGASKLIRRHTIHVWTAFAAPAPPGTPLNFQTTRVSRYVFGSLPNESDVRQFQFHPPNLPLFACGDKLENCRAFIGDYIDVQGAPPFVPKAGGGWEYNLDDRIARVLHAVWTDNRDVRPPSDGNWHLYAPPNSPFSRGLPSQMSLFDPNAVRPTCTPEAPGFTRAGMRNQNLYTSRITEGLVAGSPQNAKPLGFTTIGGETFVLQRAFVVFVHNLTDETATFRLTIGNQPADAPAPGKASFSQFPLSGHPDPLTELFVRLLPRSSATRTVFVTSGIENASVTVRVEEFSGLPAEGGELVDPAVGGLQSVVVLNPDLTNPDLTNPDLTNPDLTNISVAEVYNPDLTNPDLTNPDLTNPDLTNPDLTNPDLTNPDLTNPDLTNVQVLNPDLTNPDLTNPDLTNPDLTNPDLTNPDLTNPDLTNGTITDATWTVRDEGNTTGGYKVKLLVNGAVPPDFKTQLIIHRGYSTPVPVGCEIALQRQPIVLANIPNPEFINPLSPDLTNPDVTNPDVTNATFHVGPGDDWVQITLRILDQNPTSGPTAEEFLTTSVTPAVIAQAVNTEELAEGGTTPPVAVPGTSIVFLVPPGGGTVGEPMSPAVQVQVRDDGGAVIPAAMVTLAIQSGPEGGSLSGNTATTDAVGIARFPALTVSPAGVYVLTASVAGAGAPAPAITAPFMVLEACTLDGEPIVVNSIVQDSGENSAPVASREADFDGDQHPDLVVVHADGTVTKMSGDGVGGFERRFQLTIPDGGEGILTGPADVVTGDFNGDGLSDIAVAYPGEEAIGIVLSDAENADEYFTGAMEAVPFTVEGGPHALAVGDFRTVFTAETDGNLDLAVAATDDNTVWILFGDGEGGFDNGGSMADTFGPSALTAGDMDGDGLDDLVLANRGTGPGSVQVLLARLFYDDEVPAVDSDPAGVNPTSVAIADFNNDGHRDVAVSSAGGLVGGDDVGVPGDVRVLFGDSAGNLTPGDVVVLGGLPQSVAAGDLDGDGFPDLAVANGESLLVAVNDGKGGFGEPLTFAAGSSPGHVTADDVNGDEQTDLIITNRQPDDAGRDTISVFLTSCGASTIDLAVTIEDSPDPVTPGDAIVYETVVTNNGPFTATGVTLTQTLGGALLSASSTVGSCGTESPVTCDLGALPPGGAATITIGITAPGGGPVTSRATARGAETDRQPANNTAIATTAVTGERTFVVTNTNAEGAGSLAQAILDANANRGFNDTILFAIPGEGPHVITPAAGGLPGIDDPVLIDAPTTGECAGAPPTVEIDGISAGAAHGLFVNTSGAVIRGLAITRFTTAEFAGIFMAGGGANVVECSYIGVAPDGVTAKGNFDGVRIGGSFNNTVGGTTAAVRNVISGNLRNGVLIRGPEGGGQGSVMQNLVQGNFIGTDATGTLALGNGANGVQVIDSAGNSIGGPAGARNVISGNTGEGVRIDGSSGTNNTVRGNFIGTDATGTLDRGNGASGVFIRRAPLNTVSENVVSGNNGFAGIAICGNPEGFCGGFDAGTQGGNAAGNGIFSNRIGRGAGEGGAIGNSGHGISIDGAPGTRAFGNEITGSGQQGIVVFGAGADGNELRTNNVFANGGLGIDLGADGVTANDAGDGDAGPNGLQNFPVLRSATSEGVTTIVQGSLDSTPNTEFTIDFYFSGECDPSGHGEGLSFFGTHTQSTDEGGALAFEAMLEAALSAPGTVVTAVATSAVSGSSEFSACVTVNAPAGTAVDLAPDGIGEIVDGVPYNETRAVQAVVVSEGPLNVLSMTLDGLSIGTAESAIVGARIYEIAGDQPPQLLASGDVEIVEAEGSIEIPIEATLSPENVYRIGFFVQTIGQAGQGSATMVSVVEFPYDGEPRGLLQVEQGFSSLEGDTFPDLANNFVPQITIRVQ